MTDSKQILTHTAVTEDITLCYTICSEDGDSRAIQCIIWNEFVIHLSWGTINAVTPTSPSARIFAFISYSEDGMVDVRADDDTTQSVEYKHVSWDNVLKCILYASNSSEWIEDNTLPCNAAAYMEGRFNDMVAQTNMSPSMQVKVREAWYSDISNFDEVFPSIEAD